MVLRGSKQKIQNPWPTFFECHQILNFDSHENVFEVNKLAIYFLFDFLAAKGAAQQATMCGVLTQVEIHLSPFKC